MSYNDVKNVSGLSQEEAERILLKDGANELPSSKPRSPWRIAIEVIREPMFLLLVAGGIIYLLLGDVNEALLLIGFVFVVIGITFHQERKTENALQALKDMSSPRALVIRDGVAKRIEGRAVVCGDSVVIAEGDRIPADGVVVSSTNLSVDESLLTGESVPVRKCDWDGREGKAVPGGDDEPYVFSGCLVVQGQALILVRQTGIHTEVGKIGKSLQSIEVEKTALQRQTSSLVRNLAIFGSVLSLIVVVAYGLTRGDWLHGVLAGVALAMAMLPEEFPVVLTIFLALGAWRISKSQVLARRMPAVEILGTASVLCVDKTGTLTMNQMSIGQLYANDQRLVVQQDDTDQLPENYHQLIEFGILASQRDPFDPMEKAFHVYGQQHLEATEHIHMDWSLVHQYPLSRSLMAMSHVWESKSSEGYVIAAKGAPEAIFDLCHLSEQQTQHYIDQVMTMARDGLRVLAVAGCYFSNGVELPSEQHQFEFKLIGLVGLVDPVRGAVPNAISECRQAGIRVVMITGDYPATAKNIAEHIGLDHPDRFITGDELTAMSDAELQKRISGVNVFARVVPEQKLKIVKALKQNGEVVAMTGDGVNDAPALKAADIGIAMGGRGTDVAREASGLVLLNDDFSSIVTAIRLGRRIFDNLRKAMAYIFAVHVPIAGLSLIPVVLGWPLILMPIHIVFMELIIDPACSTVFEAEEGEADVMRRSPRKQNESIFDKRTVVWSLLQGVCILLVTFCVYALGMHLKIGEEASRTMTFTSLIVANLMLIITNVSWSRHFVATLLSKNQALHWVVAGATLFLVMVTCIPNLRGLFGFMQLSVVHGVLSVCIGIASVLWFEVIKLVMNRNGKSLLT